MKIKNITISNIIILTVLGCFSFGLGLYTDYRVNMAKEQSIVISYDIKELKTPDKTVFPNGKPDNNTGNDDPLIHLKMLQKDVETFKALMEEVKNELFVTKT